MNSQALHPAPSTGALAREQLRTVAAAVWRETALLALGLLLLTVFVIYDYRVGRTTPSLGDGHVDVAPEMFALLSLLGLAAPVLLWWNEGPARRDYHWSMPVDRTRHTLLKAAVGWLWMQLAVAIFVLWAVAAASLTGGRVSTYHAITGFDAAANEFVRSAVAYPVSQWLVPFTAMTITYLFSSAVSIGSDHPWRWYVGAWAGLMFFGMMSETDVPSIEAVGEAVVEGRYSLKMALQGTFTEPLRIAGEHGRSLRFPVDRADLGAWLGATALWGGLAAAGMWVALRRRGEG